MNEQIARRGAIGLWLLTVPWLLFPTFSPGLTAVAATSLLLLWPLLYWGNRRQLPQTPLNPYLLVFLLFTLIAFIVSPTPDVSLPKLLAILAGAFGYLVVFTWLAGGGRQETLWRWLAAAGTAVALGGPFALLWPMRQLFNLQLLTSRIPHLSGDFYLHHNEWAGTLVLLLPFAVAVWRSEGRQRYWGVVATGIIGFGLLLSQSRNAIFAAFILVLVLQLWGRLSARTVRRVLGVSSAAGLTLFALARFDLARLSGWIALADVTSKSGASDSASWVTRLEIWRAAVNLIGDYPLWGAGLYAFDPVARANYPFELIGPTFPMTHAHNLLLQSGASYGWPGLIAVALLWTAVLFILWQTAIAGPPTRRPATILAAAVITYLSFNVLDTITLGQKPGLFVWLILGGVAALGPQLPRRRLLGPLAALPLLLLLFLLVTPARHTTLANQALDHLRLTGQATAAPTSADFAADPRREGLLLTIRQEETAARQAWMTDPEAPFFLQSQARLAIHKGEVTAALLWLDHALALDPGDARSYFWRATAHEHLGDMAAARSDYLRAAQMAAPQGLDNRWQARTLFNWGRMLFISGDSSGAVTFYTQAIRLQPTNPWYHRGLGDALTAVGDAAGAAAAYLAADSAQ